MKLTIGTEKIFLPVDAKISIERKSPFLNKDPGEFSYPFPVPTAPNQQLLGWPGKLQRVGDMPDQTFILEEGGLQVVRGEVDYEPINKKQIGLILKSGNTLFRTKMAGTKLNELDYGYESWLPELFTDEQVLDKLAEWDTANTTSNGKYVVSPCAINGYFETPSRVNEVDLATGALTWDPMVQNIFMLQFRAHWILNKIFENAGYAVLTNELASSEFSDLIVFSRIICLNYRWKFFILWVTSRWVKQHDTLHYNQLMPDITVLDFVDNIGNMTCLMFDIDERQKTVRIIFKKNVFAPGNISALKIVELAEWEHPEERVPGGFKLSYKEQDDSLDTYSDFPEMVDVITPPYPLPSPRLPDQIISVPAVHSYYIADMTGNEVVWKTVGRLREILIGSGDAKVELAVKVPKTYTVPDWYLCPKLELTQQQNEMPVPELIVSLFHGRKLKNGVGIPYVSGEQWGVMTSGEINTENVTIIWAVEVTTCLTPAYLYEKVYSEFLNWKGYRARGFIKYIQLTLPEVLSLRWDKKYVVDGIEIILDKVNFDLPHKGTVKIEGFTG